MDYLLKWLGRVVIVLTIAIVWGSQVWLVMRIGNSLSPLAIMWGESNAVRAAEYYATHGFTKNAGLPLSGYGDQFPGMGVLSLHYTMERGPWPRDRAYTHYPPAPPWSVGVLRRIFGKGHLARFRIFPLTVGLVCLIVFGRTLSTTFGEVRGALLLVGCALAPMFSNMMHGLTHHSNAHSLLLVELAILLRLFQSPRQSLGWGSLGLFGLGFVQGWLSFDYCFLVTFAGVPVAVLWEGRDPRRIRRLALQASLALGLGFVAAHLLHLLQVAAYYGSVEAALADWGHAAAWRAGDPSPAERLGLLWTYLTRLAPQPKFFGWSFPLALGLVGAMLVVPHGVIRVPTPRPLEICWTLSRSQALQTLTVALLVSLLWVVVMWQQAMEQGHVLPRLLFLFYFCCLLVAVNAMTIRSCPPGE